jgi:hypothetical protein
MFTEMESGHWVTMTDHPDRPRWPMTPMSVGDPASDDPPRRPSVAPGEAPEAPASDDPPIEAPRDDPAHGPGGMDAIEDAPVRAPDDDDAPGGMTGIPDPEDA